MKAHRQIDKMIAHSIWSESVDDATRAAIALVLYILYARRRWHKERIIKLYGDIVEIFGTPLTIFGREVTNRDVEKYIMNNIPDIDFDKIKVNTEKYGECVKREKHGT